MNRHSSVVEAPVKTFGDRTSNVTDLPNWIKLKSDVDLLRPEQHGLSPQGRCRGQFLEAVSIVKNFGPVDGLI